LVWAPIFALLLIFKRDYTRIIGLATWFPKYIRKRYIDPIYNPKPSKPENTNNNNEEEVEINAS